nr:carotenoid biosynthesis protein [Candidatus Njordarchaeum guaymaensis]
MQASFVAMEIMSMGLFAVCSWHALKVVHSKPRFLELVMAAVFGVLLEELNVLISGDYYVYGKDFLIIFDQAPLAIGLGWAVIIYSAMSISDAYGFNERVKPFFDAIQAILIDLAMDAVAIRLGFWRWPIPLTDGWFGVPGGNFYGWMFVVAIYSAYTRLTRYLVEKRKDQRYILLQLVSPPICYGVLYSLLVLYLILAFNLFATEVDRLLIVAVQITLFALIVIISTMRRGFRIRSPVELPMSIIQLTFHLMFLGTLLATGMYIQIPAMVPIAIVLLVAEAVLHMIPNHKLGKDAKTTAIQ